jgi:hypothetical protein
MSDAEFYQTRAGRTYYEKTLPELVEQIKRLAEAVEKLVAAGGSRNRDAVS